MRISVKTKIMKLWETNGIIFDNNRKTAEKFAKAISEMDATESEKIQFAEGITKIYE